MEKSSFAGGCFWGVEHAFKQISGVTETAVGYQGGHTAYATYKQVCSGATGHAEVVQVTFDETVISYERLLDAFFIMHNPTELNRQGPDTGTQYRSALFPTSKEQEEAAKIHIEKLKATGLDVVTTIEADQNFIKAEDNHQDYLENTPGGYCHIGFDVFSKLKQGQF